VILSEGLGFDGWNELWVGYWEPRRDESAWNYWYGQVNLGCHSTRSAILAWRAELPKKGKENSSTVICSHALQLTIFILLPITYSNHHQNHRQTRG
jgi:hypothetical protein